MNIVKHLPVLQILAPFMGALLCSFSFNLKLSRIISLISVAISFFLSVYAIDHLNIKYDFGGWNAPIGIEYVLDHINQPIIIFINFVLLFFLLFSGNLIDSTITQYISKDRAHIFYSILLFAHLGYLGVISTNDLFNIYVFIEISSLSTYVLMSKGKNSHSLIGAFDYLMMGTIGATMILIGIGFLFAETGSLNITDIAIILKSQIDNQTLSKTVITGIAFFLSGAILKMAFFPMHFWMIRAYNYAPTIILTYLSAISSMIGVYLILRFMHFTVEAVTIYDILTSILRPIAILTIAICTFLALKSNNLKEIVIYSTASQIGYIFLLITIPSARNLLFQILIFDSLNKIALFTLIAHIENKHQNLDINDIPHIIANPIFKICMASTIIFSSGVPLTGMFITKIQLFDLLLHNKLNIEFITVVLGSVLAILYHLRMVRALFFSEKDTKNAITIDTSIVGLSIINVIQILLVFFITEVLHFVDYTKSIIPN